MSKPPLMLGVPNSGTSWLGELIGRNLRVGSYYREYFNVALCPRRHEQRLRSYFGSELISSYMNIATGWSDGIDEAIMDTWFAQSEFTFTKDVFNPAKLPVFQTHFDCFVLHRDEAMSWPPSRGRVYGFGEAYWHAFKLGGEFNLELELEQMALQGRRHGEKVLLGDAALIGVPVVNYSDVMTLGSADLADLFAPLLDSVADVAKLAIDIVAHREVRPRKQWVEGGA